MLGLTSTLTPAPVVTARTVTAEPALLADEEALPVDTGLFVGATGLPIPTPTYITDTNDLYVHCYPPMCTTLGVFTPEALNPATGVKSLPLDTSRAQGAASLTNAISQQLADGHDHISVFGISQGATVESAAMENIVNGSAGMRPAPDQLSFVLAGDPNSPNGGLLERLDVLPGSHLTIPSLGATFGPATPVTEYPTAIYDGEYDGFADFPKYPIDVLSQLNAYLGVVFVHSTYQTLTPDQLASAVEVPTSAGYAGATTYYMIPTAHLPLLDPLRMIPGVGPLVADLIGPDLRVLVNLGYGDPDYGWVNADANVPTPVGFLPTLADVEKVPDALLAATEEGIRQFISDLETPSQLFSPGENPITELARLLPGAHQALSEVLTGLGFLPPGAETSSDGVLSVVNAFGGAASAGYAALLPLADVVNALLTTLPAVDANVFVDELADGNLLDAIGLPIAGDLAAVPLGVGLGVAGVAAQVLITVGDLVNPFINVQSIVDSLFADLPG